MKNPSEWLSELVELPGVSGDEKAVADVLSELTRPFVDESFRDAPGNLIVRKKGTGRRVLLTATMDTPGLTVTHIDERGFVRFGALGGWPEGAYTGCPVRFTGGARGVLARGERTSEGKQDANTGTQEAYIDVGARNREQTLQRVAPGERGLFEGALIPVGDRIRAPHLSGRTGCAVLLSVLEGVLLTDCDLFVAFLAQSRVGARGAAAAVCAVKPEWALTLDAVRADDGPGDEENADVRLGAGPVIALTAGRAVCAPTLVQKLLDAARGEHIEVQTAAVGQGAYDIGVIQKSEHGVPAAHLGIPVRYVHTPCETADPEDMYGAVALLRAVLREM